MQILVENYEHIKTVLATSMMIVMVMLMVVMLVVLMLMMVMGMMVMMSLLHSARSQAALLVHYK